MKNPARFIRDTEGTVALDTQLLEQELARHNGGIDLAKAPQACFVGDETLFRTYVPHFDTKYEERRDIERLKKTMTGYRLETACAMAIAEEELPTHMVNSYIITHFNYLLGKRYIRDFPHNCCGVSGRNVQLSLLEFGYVNAMYVYANHPVDHAYLLLPFVTEQRAGSIVIDPTSDQLWDERKPRNDVFVAEGTRWEYRTDWEEGADLFPTHIGSILTVKKALTNIKYSSALDEDAERHLGLAFANPVSVRPRLPSLVQRPS